jgi:hypothetical protein
MKKAIAALMVAFLVLCFAPITRSADKAPDVEHSHKAAVKPAHHHAKKHHAPKHHGKQFKKPEKIHS